jgi:hypothetical protein
MRWQPLADSCRGRGYGIYPLWASGLRTRAGKLVTFQMKTLAGAGSSRAGTDASPIRAGSRPGNGRWLPDCPAPRRSARGTTKWKGALSTPRYGPLPVVGRRKKHSPSYAHGNNQLLGTVRKAHSEWSLISWPDLLAVPPSRRPHPDGIISVSSSQPDRVCLGGEGGGTSPVLLRFCIGAPPGQRAVRIGDGLSRLSRTKGLV